jgi:hypothetical protein
MLKFDMGDHVYIEFAAGDFLAKINDRPHQRSWYKHVIFRPDDLREGPFRNPNTEISWLVACEAVPGKDVARDKYSALVVSNLIHPYEPKEVYILFNGETKELLNGNIFKVILNEKMYKYVMDKERSIQRGFIE